MPTLTDVPQKLIIGGDEHFSADTSLLTVVYPGDHSVPVGECHVLEMAQLDQVCHAAKSGFDAFRFSSVACRVEILTQLSRLVEAHREKFAKLIVMEAGKPHKLAMAEIDRAVALFAGYANWLNTVEHRKSYFMDGYQADVAYFPLGPVLAITPYNLPLNLVVHKLAPAIAAGNSFTLKPASKTPLTALHLGGLALEAGYDAMSVVPCGTETAEALVTSDVFEKLSFTGSAEVGWRLRSISGQKDVTLELGGNAACIVEDFPDQELEQVAQRCAEGAFWYAGQICISVQRLFINKAVSERFYKAFIDAVRALKVGDPKDPETDIGPMISLDDVHRTRNLVNEAIHQGANALYGGSTYNLFTMNPTVLNRTTPQMRVNTEECFAPIVTYTEYDRFEDALAMANDSAFGLQAGVFTQDKNKVEQAYQTLDVGGVVINDVPTLRLDGMPYGGVKASGIGREGILSGVAGVSNLKTLIQKA
ncbi:MAG: aldehyde dehydrogenase family protein [Vampirovibrio sp.]|nr:aldehyde dehydrogenase family protein [Vampirovibrio sp.]